MTSLAVTPSMLKTSVKSEVLLLNSGYAPDNNFSVKYILGTVTYRKCPFKVRSEQ